MNQTELNQILEALKYVVMDAEFKELYKVETEYFYIHRLKFISYLGSNINLNELVKVAPKIQEQTGYKINCLHISAAIKPNDYTYFEISFNK
jgi:hypothetical protein